MKVREYYMDKELKTKLSNHLKHETEYVLKYEENINKKLNKVDTLFNLQKVLNNYEELEPILKKFFSEKAQEERWARIHKTDAEKEK